ncbi:hypothetical protein OF83DRAFT_1087097 [Amylostereum chailletii]|nr:hypothetical protein OF83DRAFT_1087097 [Amylostereum chailletii]
MAACSESDILDCTGTNDTFGNDVHDASRIISIGAIVGIVIGAISTIASLVILIILYRRKQRLRQAWSTAPYYDGGFRPQTFTPSPYYAPPVTHPPAAYSPPMQPPPTHPPSRSMSAGPNAQSNVPSPDDGYSSQRLSSLHSDMAAYQSDLMARTRAQGVAIDQTGSTPYHPYR